jgi:hypothetical protein
MRKKIRRYKYREAGRQARQRYYTVKFLPAIAGKSENNITINKQQKYQRFCCGVFILLKTAYGAYVYKIKLNGESA